MRNLKAYKLNLGVWVADIALSQFINRFGNNSSLKINTGENPSRTRIIDQRIASSHAQIWLKHLDFLTTPKGMDAQGIHRLRMETGQCFHLPNDLLKDTPLWIFRQEFL